MQRFVFLLRLLLGGLLVITGLLKAGHAPELASAIAGFRLLPPAVIAPFALVLPYFEIILGGYLIAGLFTRIAGWVALVQFVFYAAAIASAVVRGIPANCGCFGPSDQATADWPHVAFDLALAFVAFLIAHFAPGVYALDRRIQSK
jgi:putative oxidoreductase